MLEFIPLEKAYNMSPSDVQPDQAVAMKVVAVAGSYNDYAVYRGPPDWSDEAVAAYGDKLSSEQAANLFYVMRAREYRN